MRFRDAEVSHIAAGYWYNSAEHGKVRVDETYDGAFGSSLFDYTDTNADGGVMNHQVLVSPNFGSKPACFDDYVQAPAFPLVTADLLRDYNATFGGVVQEPLLGVTQTVSFLLPLPRRDIVASVRCKICAKCWQWDFLFGGSLPVIAYLNTDDILIGYDFWGEDRRTKVVTRFFAHQVGPIVAEVFEDFPCPGS